MRDSGKLPPQESQENPISNILDRLSKPEQVNMILQSFIVASGKMPAHELYILFLAKNYNISFFDAGKLLHQILDSLDEDSLEQIMLAAYRTHGAIISGAVKELSNSRYSDKNATKQQSALKVIKGQIPNIGVNQDLEYGIGNQLINEIANLEIDLESLDNPTIKKLKEIAGSLGYYNKPPL